MQLRRWMQVLPVLALALVAATRPATMPATTAPGSLIASYPPEDLDVYRQTLYVHDPAVQRTAIQALMHYPEGFDILAAFVEKEGLTENTVFAGGLLTKFAPPADLEERLKRLYDRTRQLPAIDRPRARHKAALAYTLLSDLYELKPKEYAQPMVESVCVHLQESGRNVSFTDPAFDQIHQLQAQVGKEPLYPAIPYLVDDLEAFFTDVRTKAYKALVELTGESYPFDARSDQNADTLEKYRALYDAKFRRAVPASQPATAPGP